MLGPLSVPQEQSRKGADQPVLDYPKIITVLMVRSLVEGVTDVINELPTKNGISDTLSPATITEGKPKFDFSREMIAFGEYALVYTGTSNGTQPRAVPAIALRRSNNAGGNYFMSFHTGKRING